MRSIFTSIAIAACALSTSTYAQLTSTNLPIIHISTSSVIGNTQISGNIKVIDNISGVNQPADVPAYTGIVGVKLRGASSVPKKSLNVETWQNIGGTSLDVPLLGMPAENDWVLLGTYPDRSMLRNLTGFYIYNQMGYYATRMRLCEVLLNEGSGDVYMGVYLFGEKIKRDQFRVDIAHLQVTDNAGDQLTGGYIVKIDESNDGAWTSAHLPPFASGAQTIQFHYEEPSDGDITPVQVAYIKGEVKKFEDSLSGANYQDTLLGWRAYASNKWFRDFIIFNEVMKSKDAYRKSTYIYKDKLKKIRIGPPWDLELSLYNTNDCNTSNTTGWAYDYAQICDTSTYLPPFWYAKLMTDTAFVRELKCRYTQMRTDVLDTVTIFHYIDSINTLMNVAQGGGTPQGRNFVKWPIWGVNLVNEPLGGAANYVEEVTRIKTFIKARLTWLDGQWLTLGCTLGASQLLGEEENSYISPNPANGDFSTHLVLNEQTNVKVTVRNLQGAIVYYKEYTLSAGTHRLRHDISNLAPSMYLVTLQQNDMSRNFKLVKN